MRKRTNYRLRSMSMAHNISDDSIPALVSKVASLDPTKYDWTDLAALGISQSAWNRVERLRLSATKLFCHPDAILADSTLIAYYRGLAMLPLKGMAQLATGTDNLEAGKGKLTAERAQTIVLLLNEIISGIIQNVPGFLSLQPDSFIRATTAVTTDGRWRNTIGEDATRIVKDMIVRYLSEQNLVASVQSKSGHSLSSPDALPIDEVRALVLTNSWTVRFGSEPDIEICDPRDTIREAIEIKGGLDPAGALERLGAAKKSFANARERNSGVRTTLLMSAITPELSQRADQNTETHELISLDDVLLDDTARQEFLHDLRYKARL